MKETVKEKFILPTIHAGDIIEIMLDEEHSSRINHGLWIAIEKYQIISHKPAPKPEPTVVYQTRDYDNEKWNSYGVCDPSIWRQVRKITIDPTTLLATIEDIK